MPMEKSYGKMRILNGIKYIALCVFVDPSDHITDLMMTLGIFVDNLDGSSNSTGN